MVREHPIPAEARGGNRAHRDRGDEGAERDRGGRLQNRHAGLLDDRPVRSEAACRAEQLLRRDGAAAETTRDEQALYGGVLAGGSGVEDAEIRRVSAVAASV